MKFIIDDKIPFIKDILEPYADVIYCPGSDFNKEIVNEADALIIRTRTHCNEKLLAGSQVQLIATATIGHDHIDKTYCNKQGIKWINAPGCNAASVEQYMMAAFLQLQRLNNLTLEGKTLGVIGVGNTGRKTAKIGKILGMEVLLNDPPRERVEGDRLFTSLSNIRSRSDLICFHVPLNRIGPDKTYHMVNQSFIEQVRRDLYIFNTSRGEVINNQVLKESISSKKISGAVLDVWENEPGIDLELMNLCQIATPHIAGYSADGKAKGTENSVQALSRFFKLGIDDWKCEEVPVPQDMCFSIDGRNKSDSEILYEAVHYTYPIEKDDQLLRKVPETFEQQRGNYPIRREFEQYQLRLSNCSPRVTRQLKETGFKIHDID